MSPEQRKLEATIAALEAQRSLLGDEVVDASVSGLRDKIASLVPAKASEPEQTLKQVCILFLDVVGSTTLSQRLDPEEISVVMDGALARATTLVEAHGGRVLQYAGDNLLAGFGTDKAREDDAERAVRCGLELLALGKTLGAEVHAAHGHADFDVRVGIHTGAVLLRGGVDDDGTIRGIAVNVAARMEQTAPTGALRISQDTYTQVRGVFDVIPQEPLAVKGVDAPVTSYLVQRLKPRAFRVEARGIEGITTRMIGRDAELEVLQDAFKRLHHPGAGLDRVTVVAEAGVGKSRLLYEFRNWAEARAESFFVLQARATPPTQGQAYGLLHDVLAWRFEIDDNDPMEVAKAKLEAGLMPLFVDDEGEAEAEAHAHLLGQLIGVDYDDSRHIRGIKKDGRQIRNRGFHAAAQALRRIAAQGKSPLVVYLDDLHWADDASLDFIEYLAQVDRDVPMLLVALTRPTLFERRPTVADASSSDRRIELRALDKGQSRDLANELLKKLPEIPAALCELVIGGADGNPFYMEELVKMLIDQGAIDTSHDRWSVDANKLVSVKVPATLTGVLQARLDGLPQSERHALQLASVIGQNFWDAALAHIEADAVSELGGLSARELIDVKEASERPDDVREYAFRHQILHQVTYDTVLKRVKRDAHAKTAHWLAEHSGTRAKALLGVAAEHYERAGDVARAAEFYAQAAAYATSTFANEAALDYTARASRLAAPNAHALRWRLHENREKTWDLLGKRPEQQEDIDALLILAETLDDDGRRADAALRRAVLAMRVGDFERSRAEGRRAEQLAQVAGREELELEAVRARAVALVSLGMVDEGRTLATAAIARAEARGQLMAQALLVNVLTICAGIEGDLQEERRCNDLALSIARRIGNRRMEAIELTNLGQFEVKVGTYDDARRHLEDALRLSRTVGLRQSEGSISTILSDIARRRGDDARALSLAESAVAITIETGGRPYQIDALFALGDAELALGRFAPATAAFEGMERLGRETGQSRAIMEALEGQMRVALARNDASLSSRLAADALVASGLDSTTSSGQISRGAPDPFYGRSLSRLTLHQVWCRAGDPRADAVLVEAHRLLMIKADAIDDAALKRSFLGNVAENREIVTLFKKSRETSFSDARALFEQQRHLENEND